MESENKDENQGQLVTDEVSLIDAVRKQIEYYFSKENLQTDIYLTQQMDANMSVPISVVMKFAKLKALTQDEAIVRKALEDSSVTIVDNRIKANIKANGRSTIILRDIAADTPVEEVREIFNYDGCKPISSVRSDIGDTWFVVMETEEDAKNTIIELRMKKRFFRGQSVKARIKTEQVVRSYFPVQPAHVPMAPPLYSMVPFPPLMTPPMEMMSFNYLSPGSNSDPMIATSVDASADTITGEVVGDMHGGESSNADTRQKAAKEVKQGQKSDTRKNLRGRQGVNEHHAQNEGRRRTDSKRGGSSRPSDKDGRKIDNNSKPVVEINSVTFPPLSSIEETPIPPLGYQGAYISYGIDEVISIVKCVFDATLPVEVKANEHSLALQADPNLDLLKRQRTFTIDQTREQLRQGRPVQRDAILPGAVDYRSLHYGDDSFNIIRSEVKSEELTKEKLFTEVNADVVSSGPHKISTSTWAAMVKFSAPLTVDSPVQQNMKNTLSAASTSPAATTTTTITKEVSKKVISNKSSVSDSKKRQEKILKATKDPKESTGNELVGASKPTKEEKKNKSLEKSTEPVTTGDADVLDGDCVSPSSPWGGKSSFASVVKQKTSEGFKAAVPEPEPKVNNHRNEISNGRNSASAYRSKERGEKKQSGVVESDGMWVKETLPPLPGSK